MLDMAALGRDQEALAQAAEMLAHMAWEESDAVERWAHVAPGLIVRVELYQGEEVMEVLKM